MNNNIRPNKSFGGLSSCLRDYVFKSAKAKCRFSNCTTEEYDKKLLMEIKEMNSYSEDDLLSFSGCEVPCTVIHFKIVSREGKL